MSQRRDKGQQEANNDNRQIEYITNKKKNLNIEERAQQSDETTIRTRYNLKL